jgi:RHS repeat-associated protein
VEGVSSYPYPFAAATGKNLELRAHTVFPDTNNLGAAYSGSTLLATATVWGVTGSTGSISIIATPSSNLVAPATTRLSASISGGVSVQSVEYRYQGQAICPAVSVAPYICDWSQLAAGSYSVTGIATLTNGPPLTSSVLNLTVAHASGPTEGYVFHHTDARGSIVATTDQYGKIAALPSYRAFGRPVNNNPVTPPVPAPPINGVALGFTGKWYDAELQLSNHGARHYDPLYSRFVSIDPVGVPEGAFLSTDRYAYANNSPFTFVDPDGNTPLLTGAVAGAITTVGYWGRNWWVGDEITLEGTAYAFGGGFAIGSGAALLAAAGTVGAGAVALTASGATGYAVGDVGYRAANYGVLSEHEQLEVQADAALLIGSGFVGAGLSKLSGPKISEPYSRPANATTVAQRASVQGKACVDCGAFGKMFADHILPLVVEYYSTGRINLQRMRSLKSVQPQCPTCSAKQGGRLRAYSQQKKKEYGF